MHLPRRLVAQFLMHCRDGRTSLTAAKFNQRAGPSAAGISRMRPFFSRRGRIASYALFGGILGV